ncbi:glycosyltransferase family 4 protein [Malikia granosa]|uniref:Glycosyltransferase WbuB n=1 Tax=Malikia granosa TaxID=263067 RepID=A0A2S9K6H7_9BURK|nr:glycosyltransferase family 4 protein [Malikia granosa]PRD66027.1 glycosyltransferase WbuB [Malikia granosa]
MRIALIADTFPPLRTSGAVQLRDLSREFARQGHALTVLLPAPDQNNPWQLEEIDGVQVLRLKAPRTKDIGYVRRTLGELVMPFSMLRQLKKSPLANEKWDGVIWYAPSIFHGPLANEIKKSSKCKGYLIIRDIFPEWAVDMGLMGRGLPYRFFDAIARYQYSVADVIGVQTPGNLGYFDQWLKQSGRQLEVLKNWLDMPAQVRCSIRVSETFLEGRKIFVYAGNMGIAQGMDILLDLAEKLSNRSDVGFLFVGRGSDAARLKTSAQDRKLRNVLFFDEIHPDEIPDLYSQCNIGIVALDSKHQSHNIPGKFLTYMQNGLPVLANVNKGNDLAKLIRNERVGQACESNNIIDLLQLAEKILFQINTEVELPNRCRNLFFREFSVNKTVKQIVTALST